MTSFDVATWFPQVSSTDDKRHSVCVVYLICRYDNSFALKSEDSGSRLGRSESNSSWDIIDDKQLGNVEDISVSTKDSSDDK